MKTAHLFLPRIPYTQLLKGYLRCFLALLIASVAISAPLTFDSVSAQDEELRIFVPLVAGARPAASAVPTSGGRVVMVVYEHLNVLVTSDIFTMNPDGSDLVQLTNATEGSTHESPAWSPDGTRIAFSHQDRTTGREKGIYVINADGSNRVRLTNSDGLGEDYAPSWSPDGSKIAYHTTNSNIPQIMVINSDGSNPQQLTDFQTSQNPQWSPDGTKIVFESNRYELGNARKEIYVMNADGSNATRLTFNPDTDDGNPRWSPDGSKIAFWSLRGGTGGTYVMDADGANLTQVANMGQSIVNWSPDGTQFIFGARPGSEVNFDIYTINIDGTDLERITETENLLEDAPDWKP